MAFKLFRILVGFGEVQLKLPGLLQQVVSIVLYYFWFFTRSVWPAVEQFLIIFEPHLEGGL